MAKRKQRLPRKRFVPYYHWEPVEKGDLWIKGPRKIKLWRNPEANETDFDGKLKELVVVQ